MPEYSTTAWERAMKVQEVILRAMAKELTWWQAAEIIGVSDRSMRRWKQRYQEHGYDGLLDRRRGKPSPKRVPLKMAEEVLQLYGEKYADLNVRHFHEKLREAHGIELSYTWVKLALQGAGLVKKGRKRGCTASGASVGRCPGCCSTWMAVGISGFRTSAGMT
jgi:transposase